MALDWKFWAILGGLSTVAVAVFAMPASPAYYGTDKITNGEYVPIVHSESGVCLTERASDGLTKKITGCFAEVGEVALIRHEPGQGSAVPIDDIAYFATGGGDRDGTPIRLVVTTHDPACTAVFMHGRDGVALQTQLSPDLITENIYTPEEIRAGIDLTYATTAYRAGELMTVLAERRDVSSVASYSVSDPPELLANATRHDPDLARCTDSLPHDMYRAIYNIVLESSRASGVSGASASSEPSGDSGTAAPERVNVRITTINNNTEVLAFLKEHGLRTLYVSEPTPDRVGGMGVNGMPASLLPDLMRIDNVIRVSGPNRIQLYGFDSTVSEGVDYHSHVESAHKLGYDGGGIGIGVIDVGFSGFDSLSWDELPSSVNFRCYHYRSYDYSTTNATLCYGPIKNGTQAAEPHGTQAVEIIMDMAPAADLYLVRVDGVEQIHHALQWLFDRVDVINLSGTFPFEGPGDGTNQHPASKSISAAIDEATQRGIIWVNAAGNHADG